MRVRRIFSASILLVLLAVAAPQAAAGGGSWMKSPDDWVEPGEEVEMVAYVGATNLAVGPWIAYLNLSPLDSQGNFGSDQIAPLGPVVIDLTGRTGYLSHRVYLSFRLPDQLVPGIYQISVTNANGDFLGDLIGGHLPVYTENIDLWYEWPVDEPLVARLPDHAMLAGAGGSVSVGEIRRGVTPTSTTLSSPDATTTAVTTAALTTVVTTNRVLDQVPATVVPAEVPEEVEPPESPWLLIAAIAITLGCLAVGSRVADSRPRNHTIETDPVVDRELEALPLSRRG